ncbi:MAG: BamA/TamA family outer membrane protein [Deltaproteobacteria bacterium]|nr:BamA/TamA family outer membrane protein [Deltaproteobacteria bacterium]
MNCPYFLCFLTLFSLFFSLPLPALEKDFFPVPIIESRPDEGQTYGIMPVLLFTDPKENAIKRILAAIGQYNSVSGFGGAGLAYFYPQPHQEIQFYAELAQRHEREITLRFFDPLFFEKYYLEADFSYLNTPFGRFFGIGPETTEGDQSNFVSSNFLLEVTGGWHFLKNFRVNLGEKIHATELAGRAIDSIADTLTRYGALPEVVDSTNLIHELSLVFDTRPDREYSEKGSMARTAYFFSIKDFVSDKTFQGFNFETIHLIPLIPKRLTTALRFNFQQMFGEEIPFYEMSQLGGGNEMRAFTPGRFVDRGKLVFQLEERINLLRWKLMGIPFEIHTDPFFELGRVFNKPGEIDSHDWQPVGGLGFRLFVPPNVVGRLDMAVGSEGFELYTQLGYPF